MRIFQRPVPTAELLVVLSFTLLACKLGKSKDDPESRELPVVDAAAPTPTPATPPATPQVPVPQVPPPTTVTAGAAVTTGNPVKQTGTTGAVTTTKPATTTGAKPATTTGSAATTSTTGSAATTTGTAQAGTTTGGVGTVSPECLAKCADRFSKCLSETKVGENVALTCRRAFQACQRDCR